MALLAFSAVVLSCFLLACVVLLVLDLRGERRAVRAALQALGKRVQAHDQQIGHLTRAVGALVPPDARPTTAHRPPSRPFKPSPEQVAAARRAYAETQALPPVDMEGDRIALQGEPSEPVEAIRARFEAEADERSRARAGLPAAEEQDEPEEEETHVYGGKRKLTARPTLLGGLAGAPLERPVSDPSRTAEAFRKPHPSSPTLVSEGIAPPPSSAPRAIPLERAANLDAATLARVDELAATLGKTREEVLALCADMGLDDFEARLRDQGPPRSDRGPRSG